MKINSIQGKILKIPAVRAAIIAVPALAMIVAIICAIPGVRHGIMGLFITKSDTPHIPQVAETYYIPTFEPEGFTLLYRYRYHSSVAYHWTNDQDEHIEYEQTTKKQDYSRVEALEGMTRTTKNINGLSVDIITNETNSYYTATWSDDQYTYSVNIHLSSEDPYPICEALIKSLTAVGA